MGFEEGGEIFQAFFIVPVTNPDPGQLTEAVRLKLYGTSVSNHPATSYLIFHLAAASLDELEEFLPELLNWLDSMIVFNQLTHESILRIADLRLADDAARLFQRRIKLDEWPAQSASQTSMARVLSRASCA